MTKEKFLEIITYIGNVIKHSHFENHVYAVGGSVRDFVMGNEIKDIDLVIDLPEGGIKFAEWIRDGQGLTSSVVVYPTYGTAMFHFYKYPEYEIECVMTRGEEYRDSKSRNPQVVYVPIKEDCIRRDLSINALYMNVSTKEIVDIIGGQKDIENKILRTTNPNPNVVFIDDPLRILRVIRFKSRYSDFNIDPLTFASMIENVDRLSIISQERITDEFNKMMVSDNPVMALEILEYIGALKYVLPELLETIDLQQNKYHFGTVWEHTLKTVENTPNDLCLRISALLHDIGKIKCKTVDEKGNVHFYEHEKYSAEMTETILRRMKYSNDFIKKCKILVQSHMLTKQWGNYCERMKLKKLRKLWYKLGDNFEDCLTLIHADNLSHKEEYCLPNQVLLIRKQIEVLKENGEDFAHYKLPINGQDVMEALQIEPSPKVKDCLKWALTFAFNRPYITKEDLLKQIKQFK